MVAQLEMTLAPGAKVRVLTGKFKGQTGTVTDGEPSSSYQRSRIPVQLALDIKWFKRQQLEEVSEETELVEEEDPNSADKEEPSLQEAAAPEVTYQWLDPSSIELEEGTQSRVTTDERAIERYATEMKEERWDPQHDPPVIFDDGSLKRPGDGHHRIRAALLAEQQILCEVRSGTLIDAIRYSCSSNQRPSLHRTNADKRQAVEMMFQTLVEEFGSLEDIPRTGRGKSRTEADWSNRRIAEHVGVSSKTVDNIYTELELNAKITHFTLCSRIEVIEADNLPDGSVTGELGTVRAKDKKQGLWVDWDNREASFIHPDKVQKTDKAKPVEEAIENGTGTQQQETAPELNGKASASPSSVEQEVQHKAASVGLNGKGKQVLPDVPRNEAPESISVSEEFSTTAQASGTVTIDTDDICIALISNVDYLSFEQVEAVWRAIIHRIPRETLSKHLEVK
ncbi:MAG: KOW motif-containing protein [Symploca sp. SIO2E9]|nr:KOW motif-containing protein [Symploca sp. SIO2E9]